MNNNIHLLHQLDQAAKAAKSVHFKTVL